MTAYVARKLKSDMSGVGDAASALGAFYTPPALAEWAAQLLAERLPDRAACILDPACGDGALLSAAASQGFTDLVGVDCDRGAVAKSMRRIKNGHLVLGDALRVLADVSRGRRKLNIDGVIANPPWGADITLSRSELVNLGYRLTSGQVDSWDLFIEGVLRAARPGAVIVAILPDALFLPEHRATREMILVSSRIEFIARLGEGIFPGVYRGTVVMVLRKELPAATAIVTCLRVPPDRRRNLLNGRETFAQVTRALSHDVPQARFQADPELRFDLDARESEGARLKVYEQKAFPWDEWLESGRGIELSKSGRIVRCGRCGECRPLPRSNAFICGACGQALDSSRPESIVVPVGEARGQKWHPLIVGEDVDRHACAPSRAIKTGVPGIRYKPLKVFQRPKLLVRKTGIGIKAAVDTSGAATNQVVFYFVRRPSAPADLLDYLEGVLCSRVLLAWHLKRQGESEWRSHPYITQHQILGFPVPVPRSEADAAQVAAIADAVRRRRRVKEHNSAEDIEVERLVAGIFGLTTADMQWVLQVIDDAQQLEPIRTLRLESASIVAPQRVHSPSGPRLLHPWKIRHQP